MKEDKQETAIKNKEVAANDPNADIDKNEETKIEMEESILPIWLTRYLQFRFNLLDRTGIWKARLYIYVLINIHNIGQLLSRAFIV